MNHLYQKNELNFALLWIGIYVVSLSLADAASASIGLEKSVTALLCLVMTAFLFKWIKQQDLLKIYGLADLKGCMRPWYQYSPLLLLISTNLWGGVELTLSVLETLLYIVSMLCVGFLEEIIFRGFLFRALCKENIKTAIVVSSVTFGIGHIVNLVNGADLLPTLLQIVYATAVVFFSPSWVTGGAACGPVSLPIV